MNKIISLFIRASEASLNAPIGPILSQYDYDFLNFITIFNKNTFQWKIFNLYFPVFLFLLENKKYEFIIKLPTINFFFNFLKFNQNYILKTDIYNIIKIKSTFNFYNLKSLYKIILGCLNTMKFKLLNV